MLLMEIVDNSIYVTLNIMETTLTIHICIYVASGN